MSRDPPPPHHSSAGEAPDSPPLPAHRLHLVAGRRLDAVVSAAIVCEWCGEDIPDGRHVQFDGSYMHADCAAEARYAEDDEWEDPDD